MTYSDYISHFRFCLLIHFAFIALHGSSPSELTNSVYILFIFTFLKAQQHFDGGDTVWMCQAINATGTVTAA